MAPAKRVTFGSRISIGNDEKWHVFAKNRSLRRQVFIITVRKLCRKWAFHGHWWGFYRENFHFFYEKIFFQAGQNTNISENPKILWFFGKIMIFHWYFGIFRYFCVLSGLEKYFFIKISNIFSIASSWMSMKRPFPASFSCSYDENLPS